MSTPLNFKLGHRDRQDRRMGRATGGRPERDRGLKSRDNPTHASERRSLAGPGGLAGRMHRGSR
jgi:hypothetical protein